MLAEIRQFRDPETGKRQVAELVQQLGAGAGFQHPVLDWLDAADVCGPALIFDLQQIEQRMQSLGTVAADHSITPLVAVKSCPDMPYLELAHTHLGGFDVSNMAEYACLPKSLEGKLVSVTSPDIEALTGNYVARGNSAIIVLDSRVQLDRFLELGSELPYLLRIQGSGLLAGAEPPDVAYYPASRFGFTPDEAAGVLALPAVRVRPPAGFHVHHGSERNQVSTYMSVIKGLASLSEQLPGGARYINLGGGWHSVETAAIEGILREIRRQFPEPCRILVEPGRWYAEGAGFAAGTIINQCDYGGVPGLTLNLSGRSHLHWSDARLVCRLDSKPCKIGEVQFFGPSCFEGDRVGKYLVPFSTDLARDTGLLAGERIIFSGVSTYSAAWNTAFNGIPQADIIWWQPGTECD